MKRNIIFPLIALAALSANAESPFRDMISAVVDGNRDILSQQAAIDADYAGARAENTLEGPEVEFEHLWASGSSDKKWNIGVTQEFSFPGLYKARSQAASLKAEASRMVLLGVKADKALAVKQLVIDIINAKARRRFYTELGDNLARIAGLTQTSFDRGNSTILDLRKMRLAVMDNDRTLSDINADIASLEAQLKGLGATLPEDGEVWLSYPAQACVAPGPDTDALLYAMRDAENMAASAQCKAIKLDAWPTFAVGYRHAFEEAQHFNGLSVSLRLPSFSQNKKREAARLQAMSVADAADDRLITQTAENAGLYESALQLAGTLEDYRALSGDNSYLQLLSKAYDGGELTVIEYLNEVNLYTSARLNFIDTEYRYNLALARLNRYRSMDF